MINAKLQQLDDSERKMKHVIALLFFCFMPSVLLIALMLGATMILESLENLNLYQEVFLQQTIPMLLALGIIPAFFYKKYLDGSNRTVFNLRMKKNFSTVFLLLLLGGFAIFLLIYLESSILVFPLIIHHTVVAITEEFMIRGLITEQLARLFKNEWVAIVASALIFAFVFHSARDVASNFLFRFPLALTLSLIYKKTKSLALPIVLHWLLNSVVTVLEVMVV